MRQLAGYTGLVVGVVGVSMSLYHVYARLTPAPADSLALRIITLAFALVLAFLLFPGRKRGPAGRVPPIWRGPPSRSSAPATCSCGMSTSTAASRRPTL